VPGYPENGVPVEGTNGLFRIFRAFTLVNDRGERKDLVTRLKGDPAVKHPCANCGVDHRFSAVDASLLSLVHDAEKFAVGVEAPAIGEEPATPSEAAEVQRSTAVTIASLKALGFSVVASDDDSEG
jgi:hypothetical protein